MDRYQKRYLDHRERKDSILKGYRKEPTTVRYSENEKKAVLKAIKSRRSRRVYKQGLTESETQKVIEASLYSPSSCNRGGVILKRLNSKIANQLIGAREWHKKGTTLGLFADMKAYKSEWERDYMPYLDAGVMAQTILLYAEANNYKACFINPNTHGKYKGKMRFCGAITIGK